VMKSRRFNSSICIRSPTSQGRDIELAALSLHAMATTSSAPLSPPN
jgi:hypothetical protein